MTYMFMNIIDMAICIPYHIPAYIVGGYRTRMFTQTVYNLITCNAINQTMEVIGRTVTAVKEHVYKRLIHLPFVRCMRVCCFCYLTRELI